MEISTLVPREVSSNHRDITIGVLEAATMLLSRTTINSIIWVVYKTILFLV